MPCEDDDNFGSEMGFKEDSPADSELGGNGMESLSSYELEGLDEAGTPTRKDGEMIESYDRRELITHDVDMDADAGAAEPYEGMEFDSEDAAREFYDAYARRVGFWIRVSRSHRSMRDGTIIYCRFVCSKEGFYVQKNQARSNRQRMVTRVGCMAMLVVRKQNSGKWLVTKFHREHNHEPVAPRKMDLKPRAVMDVKKVENCFEELGGHDQTELVVATLPQGDPRLEPHEGMEFGSEEAARNFYYDYAKNTGFTVRISKCRRARDGSIICRRFVCSKEGYYVRKFGRTKRSRALTRVGCLARLIVKKLDTGSWVVVNFEKEHNHPPFVIGKEPSYQARTPARDTSCGAHVALPSQNVPLMNIAEMESQGSQNSITWRFNKLHQEGIKFAEEGATSVEIFNVAMFALREATQKVVAAKRNIMIVPQPDNYDSNLGSNTGQLSCANNSENQVTLNNKQSSDDSTWQAASSSGVMLIQQPMNLVLIAHGLTRDAGQAPIAINFPKGEELHCGSQNTQLKFTIPVSIQKQLSAGAFRLDGNGSVNLCMSAGRKRKHKTSEDTMDNFDNLQYFIEGDTKQDETATQPQGWKILEMAQSGLFSGSGGTLTNVTLSDAQVAALQAVADAFSVPTMGATSSSVLPIKVSPVSDEHSGGSKGYPTVGSPHQTSDVLPQQYQEAPKTPIPNASVHAAAVAAGARIVSPAVAASLIKAVQSRTAVHIRSGGSVPQLPTVRSGCSSSSEQRFPSIHFIRTGEPSPLLSDSIEVFSEGVASPGTHLVTLTGEVRGTQQTTAEEQRHLLCSGKSQQDETLMYHDIVIGGNPEFD